MEDMLTLNETVKESITIALIDLMNKKPIGQISISELVRVAGVSRASFYRNYESKEQVLVECVNQVYRRFFARPDLLPLFNRQTDLYAFCLPRFQFIRQNHRLFRALRNSNLISFAFEQMDRSLLLKTVGMAEDAEPYFLAGIVGCCAGVIRQWVDNDFAESPEEISRKYVSQGYWAEKK